MGGVLSFPSVCADDRVNFKVYREDISDVAVSVTHFTWYPKTRSHSIVSFHSKLPKSYSIPLFTFPFQTLLQTFVHIEFLDHLSKALGSALASPAPSWEHLEAILFLLQAASQSVNDSSFPYLQLVFAQFPHLPPHPTLSKTLLTFLGSFSSWLSRQPALLPPVVQSVFSALADPDLAPLASIAFRDICEECAEQLLSYISQLLPACEVRVFWAFAVVTVSRCRCTGGSAVLCLVCP